MIETVNRPFRVRGLRVEAEQVLAVELEPADDGAPPAWEPGAHLALTLPDGSRRQYSLCGSSGARSLRVAVRREDEGRGGSRWVHDRLRPGDRVEVGGPHHHFELEPAPAYVFVAGGIGITPLVPMVAAADAADADWVLHYFGRSLGAMAFREELAAYGDRVRLHPATEPGRPDATEVVADLPADALVYACGPDRLLDATGRAAADAGWEQRLRTERFAAPADDAAAPDPGSFDVLLAASGRELHVPADRSLLAVLADAGVDVVSDCEEGICGTCETRVLDGEVEHRDHVLTPQERAAGDCLMPCVSRAACPRLTLAL